MLSSLVVCFSSKTEVLKTFIHITFLTPNKAMIQATVITITIIDLINTLCAYVFQKSKTHF